MSEQDLINAGFKKLEALHQDTDNGYDYHFYINNLCEGVFLNSSDSDDVVDNNWIVYSFEIPSLKIESYDKLMEFYNIVKNLTGCENV